MKVLHLRSDDPQLGHGEVPARNESFAGPSIFDEPAMPAFQNMGHDEPYGSRPVLNVQQPGNRGGRSFR